MNSNIFNKGIVIREIHWIITVIYSTLLFHKIGVMERIFFSRDWEFNNYIL